MQLFEKENPFIDGADNFNACFGGTAALFNSLAWADSCFNTDNKFALVVASDLAKYDPNGAPGARATGGAGAVALLVGRNAPHLVINPNRKGHFSKNVWDFYKPYMEKEFPVVDAPLTLSCYFEAVDNCFDQLSLKIIKEKEQKNEKEHQNLKRKFSHVSDDDCFSVGSSNSNVSISHTRPNNGSSDSTNSKDIITSSYDCHIFHSPFYKLVEKSYARLRRNESNEIFGKLDQQTLEEASNSWSKEIEREWVAKSKENFLKKVHPGLMFSQRIGNMYTPSIYGSLVALIASLDQQFLDQHSSNQENGESDSMESNSSTDLNVSTSNVSMISNCSSGYQSNMETNNNNDPSSVKRVSIFSYGSGLISSVYSLNIYNKSVKKSQNSNSKKFELKKLQENCHKIIMKLDDRTKISPERFIEILGNKSQRPGQYQVDQVDVDSSLFSDAFYLHKIDEKFRRSYAQNL